MVVFTLVVISVASIVAVEAATIPRAMQNVDEHTGRFSSAVIKAIAIGIILFICAFLAFYAYWTCIASAQSSPPIPRYTRRSHNIVFPVAAVASSRAGRHSAHVAFQSPRLEMATPASERGISFVAMPDVPVKAYGTKTKVTAPTAGSRASSIRRMPLY